MALDMEGKLRRQRKFKRELRVWGIAALLLVTALSLVGSLTIDYLEQNLDNPQESPGQAAPDARALPIANPLRNAYFGDLHVHSSMSLDANVFDARNGPRAAYRFAKGESFVLPGSGVRQKLAVPLDFAAVTDHAESFGPIHQCYDKASTNYWSFNCMGVRYKVAFVFSQLFSSRQQSGSQLAAYDAGMCGAGGKTCAAGAKGVWQDMQAAARENYEPGYFTTFNAFEYSPTLAQGGGLNRSVVFRGDVVPSSVFSAMDGFVEDLFLWLDSHCTTGCKALTIANGSNFSWGLMFGDANSDGTPLSGAALALRARYDALVEVFQAKGSSECAAGVDGSDAACNFENILPACTSEDAQVNAQTGQHASRCIAPSDTVRSTLKKGLALGTQSGLNPYKLGMLAGSDTHNGTPGDTQENSWNGHAGVSDALPAQRLGYKRSLLARMVGLTPSTLNPGGLTGVWAEENTRAAIWDALHRKETFATSGTRVRARMFASFDFPSDLHTRADAVRMAYQHGVPMGGDLPSAGLGQAPSFLVMAARDPHSAPLQRIQVVKGWVVGTQTKEQVYDVACSDGIQPDVATNRCADNGATVNLSDCSISANKGADTLAATWRDPDFDPHAGAFYYVRVLENPVCRYSQRDALAAQLEHPANVPTTIQERAWTTPIWYSPTNP